MAKEGGLVMGRPPVAPPVLAMYIGWLYSQCSQFDDSIPSNNELDGVNQRNNPHTYSCPTCNMINVIRCGHWLLPKGRSALGTHTFKRHMLAALKHYPSTSHKLPRCLLVWWREAFKFAAAMPFAAEHLRITHLDSCEVCSCICVC